LIRLRLRGGLQVGRRLFGRERLGQSSFGNGLIVFDYIFMALVGVQYG
jgi:hypothetical protein